MLRTLSAFAVILLISCTSRQEKMAARLSAIDSFIFPKFQANRIPDSMGKLMHNFAMEFPQNPKSEEYLYRATQVSEMAGRFFETARWCEDYIKTYPKGKYVYEAITAAGANFEKSGTLDKALEYYEKLVKEYPKSSLAEPAKQNIKMLKLGLVTPEQQLNYLLEQKAKDSASAK